MRTPSATFRSIVVSTVVAPACLLAGCSGTPSSTGAAPTATMAVTAAASGPSAAQPAPPQTTMPLTELARRADSLTNPLIKALPLAARVQPATTVTDAARTEVVAPEGIWMITRPQAATDDPNWAVIHEYGELMLLAADRSRILASYPFEGVPPEWILLTGAAVYCGRGGDGGLPDSMVARLSRSQDDLQVRFSAPTTDGGTAVRPESLDARPGNWLVEPGLTSHADPPTIRNGELVFKAAQGAPRLVLDAATLAVRG